jgi:bifunctional N-acetylglucosamine-1-phosphate-uridyltransferase/glucosamine-1-phosphate-acetyltransferase GlmU-like protein
LRNLAVIILAAGIGKRLKSKKAKVLHTLAGEPMIRYVVRKAIALAPLKIVVVIGHQAEEVRACISESPKISFVKQKDLLGTASAAVREFPSRFQRDCTDPER